MPAKCRRVTITDAGMGSSYLTGKLTTGETFATYAPLDGDLIKTLKDKNISLQRQAGAERLASSPMRCSTGCRPCC